MALSRSSGHSFRIRAATAAANDKGTGTMVKVFGIHMLLYADALETTGAEVGFVVWWGFSG